MAEFQQRYEVLRLQVLKPDAEEGGGLNAAEVAWIERQGLVAWIEGDGEKLSPVQRSKGEEKQSLAHELVIVLADCMLSQAEEVKNGE